MYALVKDGVVVRTTNDTNIEWNNLVFSNVSLLTNAERTANGIYALITAPVDVPAGKKAVGTSLEVVDNVVVETLMLFDKTEEELDLEVDMYRESLVVTPWQIRKALNQLSLRDSVEQAISLSDDHNLKDAWQYATEFVRNDPLVISLGVALGKSDAELDALFELAKSL